MKTDLIKISTDIVIVGAGIAGASLAWHLKDKVQLVVLEMEDQPGYHTTGRSAAFYAETYGGPSIVPLSKASKQFLFSPSPQFTGVPLAHRRQALYAAREDQLPVLQEMYDQFKILASHLTRLTSAEMRLRAPMLKAEWTAAGLFDPECHDLDVAAIHAGFLRGVPVHTRACVREIVQLTEGWRVRTSSHEITAAIVVNAAGAWGDAIAKLAGVNPVGLVPCRRTIITFEPQNTDVNPNAPLILDATEKFYFKPENLDIWASPADETSVVPGDAQPDELDVALTIERIESATHYKIDRVKRKWAGLRSFAPDRLPVYGFDVAKQGFFWCVGQGGWGIQTAPAAGSLCTSLILGQALADELAEAGVKPAQFAPQRFGAHG
jgi:D-arginine dehydrogenase